MNILDYIKKYGGLSFSKMPFSDVDSLCLAQITYLNMEHIDELSFCSFNVRFEDLLKTDKDLLIKDVWAPKENLELLFTMAKSVRFGKIGIGLFKKSNDEKSEKQFAAVTYKLKDGLFYVAFRGTDASLYGWKEDFNLAYLKKVPSQLEAAKYFRNVLKVTHGKYILGGHSKGGNLAVFAALKTPLFAKNKVISVYDHDGPGFFDGLYKKKSLKKLHPKIFKTIPQTAIVGLLLKGDIPYRVVESRAVFLMQHNPFSWKIDGNHFKYCTDAHKISKSATQKVNNWLKNTDSKKRKLFIDSLYEVLMSTGAKTYFDLFKNKRENFKKITEKMAGLDPEVKEILRDLLSVLFKSKA